MWFRSFCLKIRGAVALYLQHKPGQNWATLAIITTPLENFTLTGFHASMLNGHTLRAEADSERSHRITILTKAYQYLRKQCQLVTAASIYTRARRTACRQVRANTAATHTLVPAILPTTDDPVVAPRGFPSPRGFLLLAMQQVIRGSRCRCLVVHEVSAVAAEVRPAYEGDRLEPIGPGCHAKSNRTSAWSVLRAEHAKPRQLPVSAIFSIRSSLRTCLHDFEHQQIILMPRYPASHMLALTALTSSCPHTTT